MFKLICPLHNVIKSITKFNVLKGNSNIEKFIEANIIPTMLKDAPVHMNKKRRVNEKGNALEKAFSLPKEIKLKGQGYPDRAFEYNDEIVYVEIKLFNKNNILHTNRTFTLCPPLSKINSDGYHYLIGFEHENEILNKNCHIIDLYDLSITLKYEWNTNNKNIYKK